TPQDARHASPIQSAALCTAPTRRIRCDRAVALKTSPVVAESAAQSPKPASTRTAGTAPSQRGPRTTAISSGASSARPTDVGMLNTATQWRRYRAVLWDRSRSALRRDAELSGHPVGLIAPRGRRTFARGVQRQPVNSVREHHLGVAIVGVVADEVGTDDPLAPDVCIEEVQEHVPG